MRIQHDKVGNAGLVDPLRDFNLVLEDQATPVRGRRQDTLERVGLGEAAVLADQAGADATAERTRDGLVLATEVAMLARPEVLATLGTERPSVEAQLPRLAKLLERPAAAPIALTPAYREIRREVSRPYDPTWVELAELPTTYRAMATRVIDTLDNLESAATGHEEHTLAYDKKISNELIDRFLALGDLQLGAHEPDGPKLGAAGQRRVAQKLRDHLNQERHVRDLEPTSPRPVITPFPVQGATVRLGTTPLPEYEQTGRNRVHNLNRSLIVDVPAGHTVIINAQSPKTSGGAGAIDLAERVLGPTPKGQPHYLDYLPGVKDGQPAEVWITVMRGKDVVSNANFAVPANPITERVTTVAV